MTRSRWYRRGFFRSLSGFAQDLVVLSLLCGVSCDERKPPPAAEQAAGTSSQADLGSVKISLVPREGEAVDILIRWIPNLDSDDWVPATASLMNAALVECGVPRASVDVRFWVQDGVVRTAPDSPSAGQELTCLTQFLRDKELAVATAQDEHEVLVRIAPPSIRR